MATLINLANNETITLLPQHVFGRQPFSSNTVLDNPKASRQHATIHWDGQCWSIQDTSSNGTYVNGHRLQYHSQHPLHAGDQLQFASHNNDRWQVLDVDPAHCLLMPLSSNTPLVILEDIVVLPDETSPQITLYRSTVGRWLCESEAGTSTLVNGNTVRTGDNMWRFIEAAGCAQTVDEERQNITTLADLMVYFKVSQDEEHVLLSIKISGELYDLGERNHHYLLLLLARQRLADQAAAIVQTEQGWIEREQLGKMLQLSESHINIQIYRLRKQLVDTLPQGLVLPQLIEKRRGMVRFVCDNVDITGGHPHLTVDLHPIEQQRMK